MSPFLPVTLVAGLVLLTAGCASTGSAAPSAATPEARSWQVTHLGTDALPEGTRAPDLFLNPEQHNAHGFGGCNRYGGQYQLQDDTLRFSQLFSTQMACLLGMEIEDRWTDALMRTQRYQLQGQQLMLLDEDGKVLAQLQPAP